MDETEENRMAISKEELEKLHVEAEAQVANFSYKKPEDVGRTKGFIKLVRSPLIKGNIQVIKKNGGENNLHYHHSVDTFWMVVSGRVRFYGPGDVVTGEFGPMEGPVTPRFSRYWFENCGEGDAELLQIAAFSAPNLNDGGRTDVSPQKFEVGSVPYFDAMKEKEKV